MLQSVGLVIFCGISGGNFTAQCFAFCLLSSVLIGSVFINVALGPEHYELLPKDSDHCWHPVLVAFLLLAGELVGAGVTILDLGPL